MSTMTNRPTLRRKLLVGRVCVVFAFLACSNLDNVIITKSANTTIQGGSPLNILDELGFVEFGSIDISDEQEFKNRGFDIDDVDSVKVDSLTLDITAPASGQDFEFIDHIAFYAVAEDGRRELIAEGGPFQAGLRSVGLDVTDVNLKDYAKAGSFSLGTEVDGNDPDNTTTLRATVALNVDVAVGHLICGD
jgi:hypothetical protein